MPFLPVSTYVWLGALASVPVIIHLINLLQRRRVKWAAMEFLLASQRKHSTWIRLKELLLMLLRMAAVAAVVLMILPPDIGEGIGNQLGVATTHHIVLLDDSLSMSDRLADGTIFDRRAKSAVAEIALQARKASGNHRLTLLRSSRATAAEGGGPLPDYALEPITERFIDDSYLDRLAGRRDDAVNSPLGDLLDALRPAELSAGASDCIQALAAVAAPRDDERRVVYLVSDFRLKDWTDAADLRQHLATPELKSVPIYLIDCAKEQRSNLAVTSLKLKSRTYAAGVAFVMQLDVTNFGPSASGETTFDYFGDGVRVGQLRLPPLRAGETQSKDFPILFPTAGEHGVSVTLADDAVIADNRRYVVVDVPQAMPCLLIRKAAAGVRPGAIPGITLTDKLAEALAPPGPRASGLLPEKQFPDFLTIAGESGLAKYRTIYLVDVDRLEPAAIRNLEAFAKAGGGVVFIVGPDADVEFYNEELYRNGAGLFPVPLSGPVQLFRDPQNKSPDIVAGDHPVMEFFRNERNAALSAVTVSKYAGVPADWAAEPRAARDVRIAATLRNGAPLIVEKPFERGRSAALLVDPLPPGSDWFRNYSFLVVVQSLQTYIGRNADLVGDSRLVGAPVSFSVEAFEAQKTAMGQQAFEAKKKLLRAWVRVTSSRAGFEPVWLQGDLEDLRKPVVFKQTQRADVYAGDLFWHILSSETDDAKPAADRPSNFETRLAINVESAEGDLTRIDGEELSNKLTGLSLQFREIGDLSPVERESPRALLGTWILYALVGLLLGEQALAYSASYHPSRKEGGA